MVRSWTSRIGSRHACPVGEAPQGGQVVKEGMLAGAGAAGKFCTAKEEGWNRQHEMQKAASGI
jgi:hypothetical protein